VCFKEELAAARRLGRNLENTVGIQFVFERHALIGIGLNKKQKKKKKKKKKNLFPAQNMITFRVSVGLQVVKTRKKE
jgi:hypothetical protein